MSPLMRAQNCKAGLVAINKKIIKLAESEGRTELTAEETKIFNSNIEAIEKANALIKQGLAEQEKERNLDTVPDVNALSDHEHFDLTGEYRIGDRKRKPVKWLDANGNEIQVLSPGQPMPRRPGKPELHLGGYVRGIASGKWDGFGAERRLAMAEGQNVTGGYLVPEEMSNEIIDLVRARSVCFNAGVRVIPMTSETLIVAKIATDPTFTLVGENQTIDTTSVAFSGVTFTAKKFGAIVTMSRELLQDASNAADIVQNALVKALAVEMDRQMLVGSGSQELTGLLTSSEIDETGSIGGITWEDVATGVLAVQVANEAPSAYVCSPTIASDLLMQTSGDGTNSAKMWLPAPPLLDGIARYATTSCPDADLFIGDFSQAAMGVRQNAEVMIATEASTAFEKNQVLIRIVYRADFKVLRGAAFQRLTGITT